MTVSASQIAQMQDAAEDMMGDTVAVETWTGMSAYGSIYGASANVTCNIDATRRLVRNAEGAEVVSEMTLHVKAADEAKFVLESRVTVATRISTVLTVSPQTFRGQVVLVKVALS